MKQLLIFVLVICVMSNIAFGATIHGSIFDLNLNEISNVKVEIDTNPKQTFVSKDGTYNFEVPVGEFSLLAEYYQSKKLISSATEEVKVSSDGNFRVDLILFPSFLDEDELLGEEISVEGDLFGEQKNIIIYIVIALIVFLIGNFLIFFFKGKKQSEKNVENKESNVIVSNDLDGVIKVIKEEGGRTTQKDIRKKIPLSEAKISLMIAELESKGVVKKIKKGRGNIIILEK